MKPILFNTEMVRAILEGRKTVTRRIVKNKSNCTVIEPYKVGDVLYVRETWSEWTDGYVYKAWVEPFPQVGAGIGTRWRPSIHMPKAAARIFLKVTGVRVERLQDITPEQAIKEGTKENFPPLAVDEFRNIWQSTIKKDQAEIYSWEANPYVWVIEFERVEKPVAAV